jgi:hypothetical protein
MMKSISEGRITGTAAAGKLETDFQSAVSKAMTDASRGAGDLQTNMQKAISDSKAQAQKTILESEVAAQRLRQEGQIAGAQGLTTIAAQKAAEAARAEANGNAARAASEANDRWMMNFQAQNERWIGEQQMQGEQNQTRGLTQLYGMDPTLGRDKFQLDIADSWGQNNRGLIGLDIQNTAANKGGTNWLDIAKFGSGFIPTGSKNDDVIPSKNPINSAGYPGTITGGGGSNDFSGWDPTFDSPTPTPPSGGSGGVPSVDYSEKYRVPGW